MVVNGLFSGSVYLLRICFIHMPNKKLIYFLHINFFDGHQLLAWHINELAVPL